MLIRRNAPRSKLTSRLAPNDLLLLHEPQASFHQETPLLHLPSHPLNPENPIKSVLVTSKHFPPVVGFEKNDSEFSFKQNCLLTQQDPQHFEEMKSENQQNMQIIVKQGWKSFEPSRTSRDNQRIEKNRPWESIEQRGRRFVGKITNSPIRPHSISQVSQTAEQVIRKPINSSLGSSRLDDVLNKIKSLKMGSPKNQAQQNIRYNRNRYQQWKVESTDASGEEISPIKKQVITTIRKHVQRMNLSNPKNHKIVLEEPDNQDISLAFNIPIDSKEKPANEELLQSKNRSFLVRSTNKKTRKQLENIIVSYRTTILELKELCGRYDESMNIKVTVPRSFLNPLFDPEDNQDDMFAKATGLLGDLGVRPVQPMTIRKYSNCVIVLINDLALIFYFSGHTYFGGWHQEGKSGLGLQWSPGRFVYYGQYMNNKREGCGIMKDYKGEVQLGQWKDNKLLINTQKGRYL